MKEFEPSNNTIGHNLISLKKQQGHTLFNHLASKQSSLAPNQLEQLAYPSAPSLPAHFHGLTEDEIKDVEMFLFFIGYGRSGHSIVASIMDAHPNVVIANEYYLFNKLDSRRRLQTKLGLFNELYQNSYTSALNGWRSPVNTSKGYNLHLNRTWQGQFHKLQVIGDKTAGATAMLYNQSTTRFRKVYRRLKGIVGVPFRVVHVVRNPYDMIATVALYHASSIPDVKVNASPDKPFRNFTFLALAVNLVLTKARAVQSLSLHYKLLPLEIFLEDLIKEPATIILEMCRFMGVACTEDYVTACTRKVYGKALRSRETVVWPRALQRKVEVAIRELPFFNRYSFSGE